MQPHQTLLDGSHLGLIWMLPFAGMLLSIAVFPLLAQHFWEHHFARIAAGWALAFIVPCAYVFGVFVLTQAVLEALLAEYLPFIMLLFTLFVVAGGIRIGGDLSGKPPSNTALLALGTILASGLGTTGASMLLIRPLIEANRHRRYRIHIFVFFIFLVSNIGGALTPLGDPPLFLGFLNGVHFLWPLQALAGPFLVSSGVLLALFFAIDSWALSREDRVPVPSRAAPIRLEGAGNILCLVAVATAVLASGLWKSGVVVPLGFGVHLPLEGVLRDGVLLVISLVSWRLTPNRIRVENAFTWTPIQEVAVLFAAIFIVMIPALAILRAGAAGALAPLVDLTSLPDGTPNNVAYFWLTGGLSSFLDNAPTYLAFFNLAGGDAEHLMTGGRQTLLAISAGAVLMGAGTYIGNAPNFMVKSIVAERGISMPSFFGYMLWSGVILLPLYGLICWLFLS